MCSASLLDAGNVNIWEARFYCFQSREQTGWLSPCGPPSKSLYFREQAVSECGHPAQSAGDRSFTQGQEEQE